MSPSHVPPRGARQPSLAAQARGRFGENEAARWYLQRGYDVLDRNWRCAHGEIDLVLGRPGLVVVCEVKSRVDERFGGPAAAVDRRKQLRLRRLAAAWLAEHRAGSDTGYVTVRFDVAGVVGARVEVVEDAF